MTDKAENRRGRPTKLTQEMVDLAFKYLDDSSREWEDREEPRAADEDTEDEDGEVTTKASKHKQVMVKVKKKPRLVNRPRLAFTLGVDEDTMLAWTKPREDDDAVMTKLREDFLGALKGIDSLMHSMLLERGFDGESSSQVTNRILAAKYGYKERVDGTSAEKPLPAPTTIVATNEDVQRAVTAFEEALRPKR